MVEKLCSTPYCMMYDGTLFSHFVPIMLLAHGVLIPMPECPDLAEYKGATQIMMCSLIFKKSFLISDENFFL